MEALDELVIKGSATTLAEFRARLDRSSAEVWKRDRDAEGRRRQMLPGEGAAFCFTRDGGPSRPAAALWLHDRRDEFHVSRPIVLDRATTPTTEQLQSILDDFRTRIIEPAATGIPLEIESLPAPDLPQNRLSRQALYKFADFVMNSDNQGRRRPDVARWKDFIIQVHRDQTELEPALLEKWLQREGLPEQDRRQLVLEFAWGLYVLAGYDVEAVAR